MVRCSSLCVSGVSWKSTVSLAMLWASCTAVGSKRSLRVRVSLRVRLFLRSCIRNGEHIPWEDVRSYTCCKIVSIEWYRRLCTSTVVSFLRMWTKDVDSQVSSRPLARSVVMSKEERRRKTLTVSRHMVGRIVGIDL